MLSPLMLLTLSLSDDEFDFYSSLFEKMKEKYVSASLAVMKFGTLPVGGFLRHLCRVKGRSPDQEVDLNPDPMKLYKKQLDYFYPPYKSKGGSKLPYSGSLYPKLTNYNNIMGKTFVNESFDKEISEDEMTKSLNALVELTNNDSFKAMLPDKLLHHNDADMVELDKELDGVMIKNGIHPCDSVKEVLEKLKKKKVKKPSKKPSKKPAKKSSPKRKK